MARAGIYKSEVVRARSKLLATGVYPSIDAVRIELGNTGSKATIHRYLKEIEEEQGGGTGTKVSVSEAIQDLVGRLASGLHEEADARVTEATSKHAAVVQGLNQTITALKSESDSALTALQHTKLELAQEQQAHGRTAAELREEQLERTKLAQEVSGLRERLIKEDEHQKSLEDKHKQARESLEHFRQAAKEQREQEHRKHDQEVQYLQSELRNINQALTQKQQETTHAHQECTRLLGELAHTQAGLHAASEEMRTLKEKNASLVHAKTQAEEFGRQLVQLQATITALDEAKTQALARAEGAAEDKRRLELDLAAAQATLDAQKSITEAIVQRFSGTGSGEHKQKPGFQEQLSLPETKMSENP